MRYLTRAYLLGCRARPVFAQSRRLGNVAERASCADLRCLAHGDPSAATCGQTGRPLRPRQPICERPVQALLTEHGFVCSMSRKGNCWDNAVAERFFLSLKMERVWQSKYANQAEAKIDVGQLHRRFLQLRARAFCIGQSAAQLL